MHSHADQVIAAVRDLNKAADLARQGAELRSFNFDDAGSLAAVFKGVDHALIVPPNPAANSKPFDRAHIANKAIDAAKAAGVKLVVLLSVLGAQYEAITFGKEFRFTEKHLEASGLKWISLRAAAFQENAIGAAQFIKQGVYGQPLGDDAEKARFAPVAVSDVGTPLSTLPSDRLLTLVSAGRIAAKLLVVPGANVNTYVDLSGPESLSGPEQAAAISRAIGAPVTYVALTDEQIVEAAKSWGFPEWQAKGMAEMYALFRTGATVKPATDFVKVMGVPMTRFEDRLRQLHLWGAL